MVDGKRVMRDWLRALQNVAEIGSGPDDSLFARFDQRVQAQPSAFALISDQESFSYSELAARSNRYARWAAHNSLGRGDVVALFMGNRAEYVCCWLGLNRAGVTVALLNTNLRDEALRHCIRICGARLVIAEANLYSACVGAMGEGGGITVTAHGGGTCARRVEEEIEAFSDAPLSDAERPELGLPDHALYIYTSGTTGLPKAAIISHRRLLYWALWFQGLVDSRPDDRMYNCLPLFHSVGGVIAIWSVLLGGGAVVIRERFSASRFWEEIVAFDCSLFQYIGELCRYLSALEPSEAAASHRLRLCVGNGLRSDVWQSFQERFKIPRILEFYASTEGNFSLYNVEGKLGAIGRVPPFLASSLQIAIVDVDSERDQPFRDPEGRCQLSKTGEVGEAIAKIEAMPKGGRNFEGYLDAADTERKILRDVFAPGDAWVRSGDLMRKDAQGFYYFVDRIGDNIRWKGENVSTLEVAQIISSCPGVIEAIVYGVEVPGHDGRAVMAALVADEQLDLQSLRKTVNAYLPTYAQPLFLRLIGSLETTETFKHKKRALVEQGFDPLRIAEPLYFASHGDTTYVRLDRELHAQIVGQKLRL